MTSRLALLSFALVLCPIGCLTDEKKLTTVPTSPFGKSKGTQAASFKQAPPATQEMALRVDRIGQKIVSSNTRFNKEKIAFLTLGVPDTEIFHQSQKENSAVYVTEGLVKQCKSDDELAAVLSHELGKMISEQMAQLPVRNVADLPPMMNPHVGNDNYGTFGSFDGSDQLVLAHYEKDRQRSRPSLSTPPAPPSTLARLYLRGAGFDVKAFDAVAPILRQADKENSVEQSMTSKP